MIWIAVILLILTFLFCNTEPFELKQNKYLIVCARYNRNVDFLKEIPIESVVIDKENVPNVANEATSYLHFIINNYDNMPEHLIFIHDENTSWHHDGKITERIRSWIQEYETNGSTYYEFNNMDIDKPPDYHTDSERKLWENVFEKHICPYKDALPLSGKCCAQFIVSKEQIQKHPKQFYQDYYKWLLDNTSEEGNGASEDMYSGYNMNRYAEWSWRFIFSPSSCKK